MEGIGIEEKVIPREEQVELINEWIGEWWTPVKRSWVKILLEEYEHYRAHYESASYMWRQALDECVHLREVKKRLERENEVLRLQIEKSGEKVDRFIIKKRKVKK